MKSPFPGMDPYLELHWRDVHTSLMVYARDRIQDQLPGDLLARVEENVAIDAPMAWRRLSPDVRVVEERRARSEPQPRAAVAVAEPVVIALDDEPQTERHIEIIDPGSGNRVVTVIEVLSPTNKVSSEGRKAYRKKQSDYLAGGINIIEIDLVRDGEFILAVPISKVPPSHRTPYMVCIRRARTPARADVYKAPLRERLPVIPVPLRPGDADAILDLQAIIDTCYDRGRYASIDYTRELQPPLDPDDARWADELLRRSGLR